MADLIIHGMEMPSSGCANCQLANRDTLAVCMVTRRVWDSDPGQPLRPDWCPLSPAPEWISVEEKLPEDGLCVLVRFDSDEMAVAYRLTLSEYYGRAVYWRSITDDGWTADCDTIPTHWMPLPEPPKEETT